MDALDSDLSDSNWNQIYDAFDDDVGTDIFDHWLNGNGTTKEWDNSDYYSSYMKSNRRLRYQLRERLDNMAREYGSCAGTTSYEFFGGESRQIRQQFTARLENGYFTGYAMLHQTDEFGMKGTVTVERNWPYSTVTFNLKYTWNDRIDPHPMYVSDRRYAKFFRAVKHPRDYNIKISWTEKYVVTMNCCTGEILNRKGYPYDSSDPLESGLDWRNGEDRDHGRRGGRLLNKGDRID
jgi:hypothetical protein